MWLQLQLRYCSAPGTNLLLIKSSLTFVLKVVLEYISEQSKESIWTLDHSSVIRNQKSHREIEFDNSYLCVCSTDAERKRLQWFDGLIWRQLVLYSSSPYQDCWIIWIWAVLHIFFVTVLICCVPLNYLSCLLSFLPVEDVLLSDNLSDLHSQL